MRRGFPRYDDEGRPLREPLPPRLVVHDDDVRLYRESLATWGEWSARDELWERIRRWRSKDPHEQNYLFEATIRAAKDP